MVDNDNTGNWLLAGVATIFIVAIVSMITIITITFNNNGREVDKAMAANGCIRSVDSRGYYTLDCSK